MNRYSSSPPLFTGVVSIGIKNPLIYMPMIKKLCFFGVVKEYQSFSFGLGIGIEKYWNEPCLVCN